MTRIEDSKEIQQGLADKRVVVLGGSSGIGLAVGRRAAAEGAQVIIASSNRERVERAVADIGRGAEGRRVDLGDENAIAGLFESVDSIDHVVYTAGDALQINELASTDLRKARNAFELRYWGALAAAKHARPHIRAGGSIVLTTGIAGDRPRKGWVIAASVCGAIASLTRALAVELAPIRVNAVSPGMVRTDLWRSMADSEPEALFDTVGKALPVGRVGEPADIAQTYLYLMLEGYSTGQVITVDGGSVLV